MRGYPTACTTLAAEGMIVRTQTRALQETRLEILQLILSEHPSACLICAEARECLDFQQTIRKVGLTTGCRWCAKDEDCELQNVVRVPADRGDHVPGMLSGIAGRKERPLLRP